MRSVYLPLVALLTLIVACGGAPAADDPEPRVTPDDYVERMSAEHMGETPEATPATMLGNAAVTTQRVAYVAGVEGVYAAPPVDYSRDAGVVLVHEWWGLNDNIAAVAAQLASDGYHVLAVDLYGGESATGHEEARSLMMAAMEAPDALMSNVAAASTWLRERGAGEVAIMGYCFGGAITLEAAMNVPDAFDAGVVYYGRVPEDVTRVASIDDPMLLHFGEADTGIPLAGVRELEQALWDAEVEFDLWVYPGAAHAFANPSGQRYDADAAQLAWERTLQFLADEL